MVPLALFKSRAMSLTAAAGFSVNAAFYGVIFLLSLYFQQVAHKSPTVTGLLFAPITAVVSVVNVTVAARMVARIGARASMTIGLTGTAGAMLLLLAVRPDQPAWLLVLLLIPVSFAGSFVVPALTIMVMGSVPAERAGTAAGIVNTSRQVGGALAVAVAGSAGGRRRLRPRDARDAHRDRGAAGGRRGGGPTAGSGPRAVADLEVRAREPVPRRARQSLAGGRCVFGTSRAGGAECEDGWPRR